MKEWNISYSMQNGNELKEFMVVLPKWWKVLCWFLKHGAGCRDIYIWTSVRH